MKKARYQLELSRNSPILLNREYKAPKVKKMLAILRDAGAIGKQPNGYAVDIGCSSGFFTEALSPYFEVVTGIDIDRHAISLAKKNNAKQSNVLYLVGDSEGLPLLDDSVDLVICNHVYEHVPSAEKLLTEIYRILKKGGICYLGAASRLGIIEPHYHLPFLSWLPKSLADIYMRASGKGDHYYESLRTYWGIKRLLSKYKVLDYTLKVVAKPDRFHARDLFPKGGILEKIPLFMWRFMYWLLPSYLLILKKPTEK